MKNNPYDTTPYEAIKEEMVSDIDYRIRILDQLGSIAECKLILKSGHEIHSVSNLRKMSIHEAISESLYNALNKLHRFDIMYKRDFDDVYGTTRVKLEDIIVREEAFYLDKSKLFTVQTKGGNVFSDIVFHWDGADLPTGTRSDKIIDELNEYLKYVNYVRGHKF